MTRVKLTIGKQTTPLSLLHVPYLDTAQKATAFGKAPPTPETKQPSSPPKEKPGDAKGQALQAETPSRDRDHIFEILNLHREGLLLDGGFVSRSIENMKTIYHQAIEPMAQAYKFEAMGHPALSGMSPTAPI